MAVVSFTELLAQGVDAAVFGLFVIVAEGQETTFSAHRALPFIVGLDDVVTQKSWQVVPGE